MTSSNDLWGAKAKDWAELQEPAWRPVYAAILRCAGVGPTTKLLDVGCGAGGALGVARELGAQIYGVDASKRLVEVARQNLPNGRIEIGDMTRLPFEDLEFDVVTSFNAFQFADDVVQALREARRVCKQGGKIAMLVWGPAQDCDLLTGILPAVFALLPPSPSDDGPDFSQPGVIEGAMHKAGLTPLDGNALEGELCYPNAETACRAIASSPPFQRAAGYAGDEAANKALSAAFARFTRPDGSVTLKNRFRWVVAVRQTRVKHQSVCIDV